MSLFISQNYSKVKLKQGFLVKRKPTDLEFIKQQEKLKSINKSIANAHARKALSDLNTSSNQRSQYLNSRIIKELNTKRFDNPTKPSPFKGTSQYNEVFNDLQDAKQEQAKLQAQIDKASFKRQAIIDHGYFFSLVPEIQMDAVWWKIKHIFNNDIKAYIESVPLFTKFFTKTMLHEANAYIIKDDLNKRKLKRRKKEALLYSSQLLHLVGKNASSYVNDSLLDYYHQDRQEQMDFIEKNRLISSNGKFRKLTPMDVREKRKTAQILNVSDTLSQIAEDRGWTFSFITITLPACKHPNPTQGKNTFDGELPSKAHKRIHRFWQRIRAYLARYDLVAFEDYMGAMSAEAHKDSTLHLHVILYHSKANALLVNKAVVAVSSNGQNKRNRSLESKDRYECLINEYQSKIQSCSNELSLRRSKGKKFCGVDVKLNERISRYKDKTDRYSLSAKFFENKAIHEMSEYNVNFDFKQSNGKAKGSTYLFKYIMKNNVHNGNGSAARNAACRWFYSARAFSFFGVENSLSKFNFICENKKNYVDLFSDHLKQCLKNHDYYTFLTVYTKFFEVERDENGAILFVKYDMQGNNAGQEYFELKPTANYHRQFVLIEKNIYNIVEINNNFTINGSQEIKNIRKLDDNDIENNEIFKAYGLVQQKQTTYDSYVEQYKMKTQGKFITKAQEQDLTSHDMMVEVSVFDDLDYFDEECQKSFKANALELFTLKNNLSFSTTVTVDQSYSSKNDESKLSNRHLQELRRSDRLKYDEIIKENHKKWLEDRKKPKQTLTTPYVVSQATPITHNEAPKKKLAFGLSR